MPEKDYLQEDLERIARKAHELGLSGSTVYITGASGLVGSIVCRGLLAHNAWYAKAPISIIAGCRNLKKAKRLLGNQDEHLLFQQNDLRRGMSMPRQCDWIIHAACPTASREFMAEPVEVIDAIVLGTRNALEFARTRRVKGVLFVSSMEAFGQVSNGTSRSKEEDLGFIDLRSVRSCYPEGKRLAELLCHCYSKEYGVPAKVARLAQTFGAGVGPEEGRVFAQFARSAASGRDIVLHTEGQSMGNYCYLADAVCGMLTILVRGEIGQTYTVANEAMTMNIAQMADLVADKISGGRSQVVFDTSERNARGYAADTSLRLDASRLRSLGWKPLYGLVEAYERMLPGVTRSRDA